MTLRSKLYIAAAAFVLLAAVAASLWSGIRMAKIEHDLAEAKQKAASVETAARELEIRAAEYKQKIDYLEESLSALRLTAAKQNEELRSLEAGTNDARRNVGRTRSVQRAEGTAAELCKKLDGLGHHCE